jgi:hypothetical protein
MTVFTTPRPITANLEVAGARVRITASDRSDTVVLVEPIDEESRKDVRVADRTKVDLTDGRLSVGTTASGDKEGSVAVTIDLPTGSAVTAYLAYSTVQVDGQVGECDLHVASGRVQLDHVAGLTANISSGEVTIGHIAGRSQIEGAAFTMRIGEAQGRVELQNSGGRAWIGHAAVDLGLSSAGCDLDIDRADGNVTAETASGAIRIGHMSNGQARLTNASGNIEVGIGEGTAASLDVASERGAVHSFVSTQGEPSASEARVSVYARSRHGDITIRRAAQEASVASTS